MSDVNAQTSLSLDCATGSRGIAPQICSYDLHGIICSLLIGAKFRRPKGLINQAQGTHIYEWSPVIASDVRLFRELTPPAHSILDRNSPQTVERRKTG